ncbi:MAG: hypothetical protein LBG71_06830 [Clostridiales Family XIII bacterium]|nr:hypothetical protein [Clostridiales Family XIII bacterium]
MRKFLRGAAIFLAPVLAALLLMEIFLRAIPNDYSYKKAQLLKDADNIRILVLGSSHALHGVNPDYFSLDGFNLANTSQSLDLDYEMLKKYGAELGGLKYVVVSVSYFSMFARMEGGSEEWRLKNYILYYGLDVGGAAWSPSNRFEILNGTMLQKVQRAYRYLFKRASLLEVTAKGYMPNAAVAQSLEKTGAEAASRHTNPDTGMFARNKEVVEEIISWCEERRVELIFVTLPAHRAYSGKLDRSQWEATVSYMESLAGSHGRVRYYNLLEDGRFTDGCFYDADHLNDKGAEKLTRFLDGVIMGMEGPAGPRTQRPKG